jgi:hypothetical protein
MAITSENFADIIKPEMRDIYNNERCNWFPVENTHYIYKEQSLFESRTPGLFKVEFSGDGMVCLSSKLYYCLGDKTNKSKFSSKGIQKNNNSYLLQYANFKKVLHENITMHVENTGMRYVNNSVVWYYTYKMGLTTKYNKRIIMDDNVSTAPLEENMYQ